MDMFVTMHPQSRTDLAAILSLVISAMQSGTVCFDETCVGEAYLGTLVEL